MSLLGGASRALAELAELDGGLGGYRAGLEEARAVADDLWRELVRYREAIEFSPERMEAVNARLFLLEKLARKYGTSADQLPDLLTQVQAELDALDTDSSRRDALAAEIAERREALMTAADALTRRRRRARSELEQRLKEEMGALGLGRATLALSLARPPDPSGIYDRGGHRCRMTSTGADSAEFLFSANPGEELRPLRKVASGGELSRLMLAMKNVLAEADPVPTLVFDEIDVGIGGRVAEAVGKRLARLARVRQVVCITHLPQIAKYADCHMLVAKSTRAGRTSASIRALDRDARVAELARMSSGVEITPTSLALAREMLKSVVNRGD
ncbi:hypothetical protein FJY70_06025 [candidate division WOR-3 bacterium]|nr:hypothetical protein [candidate division WOR-3 bacterium]